MGSRFKLLLALSFVILLSIGGCSSNGTTTVDAVTLNGETIELSNFVCLLPENETQMTVRMDNLEGQAVSDITDRTPILLQAYVEIEEASGSLTFTAGNFTIYRGSVGYQGVGGITFASDDVPLLSTLAADEEFSIQGTLSVPTELTLNPSFSTVLGDSLSSQPDLIIPVQTIAFTCDVTRPVVVF